MYTCVCVCVRMLGERELSCIHVYVFVLGVSILHLFLRFSNRILIYSYGKT
jgi:hypothetical protein